MALRAHATTGADAEAVSVRIGAPTRSSEVFDRVIHLSDDPAYTHHALAPDFLTERYLVISSGSVRLRFAVCPETSGIA